MTKYEPMARHLAEAEGDTLTLKFSQLEKIIPNGLPQSAYDHRSWWANRYDGTGSQNEGWQSVGWETSDVDMARETVTFVRAVKQRSDFKDVPYVKPLSIADAKAGLAAHLQVPADRIEIIVRA